MSRFRRQREERDRRGETDRQTIDRQTDRHQTKDREREREREARERARERGEREDVWGCVHILVRIVLVKERQVCCELI